MGDTTITRLFLKKLTKRAVAAVTAAVLFALCFSLLLLLSPSGSLAQASSETSIAAVGADKKPMSLQDAEFWAMIGVAILNVVVGLVNLWLMKALEGKGFKRKNKSKKTYSVMPVGVFFAALSIAEPVTILGIFILSALLSFQFVLLGMQIGRARANNDYVRREKARAAASVAVKPAFHSEIVEKRRAVVDDETLPFVNGTSKVDLKAEYSVAETEPELDTQVSAADESLTQKIMPIEEAVLSLDAGLPENVAEFAPSEIQKGNADADDDYAVAPSDIGKLLGEEEDEITISSDIPVGENEESFVNEVEPMLAPPDGTE